jgi:hypothetical protein
MLMSISFLGLRTGAFDAMRELYARGLAMRTAAHRAITARPTATCTR